MEEWDSVLIVTFTSSCEKASQSSTALLYFLNRKKYVAQSASLDTNLPDVPAEKFADFVSLDGEVATFCSEVAWSTIQNIYSGTLSREVERSTRLN